MVACLSTKTGTCDHSKMSNRVAKAAVVMFNWASLAMTFMVTTSGGSIFCAILK